MSALLQDDLIRNGSLAALGLAGLLATYYISRPKNGSKVAPIDELPGPERAFLLGNLKNFPKKDRSTTFTAWQKEFGDAIYIKLLYRNILLISSLEMAEELLVKRANIWSGRAYNRVVNDLMGLGWSLLQIQPGHNLTEQRKIFKKALGPQAISKHDELIEREAENFVNKLKGFSGDPADIVFGSIGTVIIETAYGAKVVQEHGAELVKVNIEGLELLTWTFQQLWLPNILPLTRFLPSWIPGIQFHKYAAHGQDLYGKIRRSGFDLVQKNIEQGTADFSVLSHYLNAPDVSTSHLRDSVAAMYTGGVDTTGSAVLNFIAHMLLFPDVQAKIQKEIDDKIGRGGTMKSAEIKSLRYFMAAWKESLRFNPAVPMGVMHTNTADDIWKGHYIPKATIVLPHIAFMMRDPRVWGTDADTFKPERFLVEYNPKVSELPDVESLPFGFGRRICPGRYMAERNGTTFVARLLQAYEIRPEDGSSVPPSITFQDDLIRRPKDLRCRFVSR
ncbi:cytochrome P450 [Serendipita vermifera]|nr:cytochrome P450 [Serendipita vermifera]